MKTARALYGCGVILGACILASRADDNPTVPTTIPAATVQQPAPPAAAAPAPSTPSSVSGISAPTIRSFPIEPETAPTSDPTDLGNADPERIAEQTYMMNLQKQKDQPSTDLDHLQRQQAYQNDWMMRGYADQLKKRGLGESQEINSVLIADPNAPSPTISRDDAMLGMPDDKKKTAKRKHPSTLSQSDFLAPKKSLISGSYQPLLKPFEQESMQQIQKPWDSAGTSSFDNGLTDLETSSGATLLPVPGTVPGDLQRRDTGLPGGTTDVSMLDIPGLTAATQGAVAPNNALTFQDPGENEITSRQHPRTSSSNNNFMMPTIPTNDISDFFKKQADAMRPPTAPNVMPSLVAPNHQPLPITPAPLARPVQQRNMGMRLHVDDPFDILRR